jgi:hypothetical protein
VSDADGLVDRLALRELVEAYASGADRRSGVEVAALFTADGRLVVRLDPADDGPGAVRRGRAEIESAISTLRRYRATCHVIANTAASVDGDGATGRTGCVAHHVQGEPGAERDRVLYIRYDDTFVRFEGGWLIDTRVVNVEFVEERPLVS